MSDTRARIHIGTSGWSYPEWVGPFYPEGSTGHELLRHYATHFGATEINQSFYSLPEPDTLSAWRDSVPDGFVFTVKASRYVTHMKKVRDTEQALARFLERVRLLDSALGPILLQLPPRWKRDPDRLDSLLAAASGDFRYAFEFRDRSWLHPATYRVLERHGAALCVYDYDGFRSPSEVTADFVYIRLHGPDGPYTGSYDVQTLAGWAGALSSWAASGRTVYCYFNNDQGAHAPRDAARLAAMLGVGHRS